MCGRFNIVDDPLAKLTSELLGIEFSTQSNNNVCPSELINTVSIDDSNSLAQVNANWGIKPSWAKKLIINAQSESVYEKKTFKEAFRERRCVIPFSGWFEWKKTVSGGKQKYLFNTDSPVLYMAGIIFKEKEPTRDQNQLVTLTTKASEQCLPIHHRMPLMIPSKDIESWLNKGAETAMKLLDFRPPLVRITAV